MLRDISERKRSEDRQRFLAEAGSLLSGRFLDHDSTLATLTRLSVPELADYCTVDVIDGNGAFVRIAVAHVDPEKESLVRAIAPFTLRLEPHPHPIVSVLSGSSPVLVPEVSREMLESSCTDEMHRELLRHIGPHSMISVPLLSSGRILGAFTLFLTESARIYGPDDLTLAMELAVRAANAVENAR